MWVAAHERRKMNANGTIRGLDMIGAVIAFVFVAIVACVFDPIVDALLAIFS
jgi:hypothetical protein